MYNPRSGLSISHFHRRLKKSTPPQAKRRDETPISRPLSIKKPRNPPQVKCSDLSDIVDFDFNHNTQSDRRAHIVEFIQYDIELNQRRWLVYVDQLIRDYVEFNSLGLLGVLPMRFVNRYDRWELAKIYEEKYRDERLKIR